ncbi:uncharacterized protein LOC131025995 isoform X2 [Salvia miltiorrhiza]|uniref:uncharacterized protein LOC131025995 isoform X2 n=1 Tax=Salvia miltiorrhiza TaxID=226208 RepID=UPI0025ABF39E|nr:uncharacterized protein LOC131025995 isoform X2 [Salvia miltiorrhiza]
MATSSSTPIAPLLNNKNSHNHKNFNDDGQFSFPRRSSFHKFSITSPSNKDLVTRRATPEVAGDLLSQFHIPGIPSWFPTDNPWFVGASGLLVGGPFLIQRLIAFTKQLDMAAQAVENIADVVENVAKKVEDAAEEFEASLPESRLKEVVHFVEHLAEETAEEADKIGDLMDKVEEFDDKLEAFLDKQLKHTDKA